MQVNELQRRQRKDHEKEVRKREKVQEKEKAERAAQAKLKMEEEAYQLQVCCLRMALLTRSCHVTPCQGGPLLSQQEHAACSSAERHPLAPSCKHSTGGTSVLFAAGSVLECSQVAALAPKIEAMEASWNRLRAISGAKTPEQVIEYWQGEVPPVPHVGNMLATCGCHY